MQLVFGHDLQVSSFVKSLIPCMAGREWGPHAAIGVAHGGFLLGGVVFHGYVEQYAAIEMSFAAVDPRWLIGPAGDRRAIVRELLRYPFQQLGCGRVTGVTPKRSRRARSVVDALGFKREGCVRRGFGGDDAIVSGLLRSEWEAGPWGPHPIASAAPIATPALELAA